MSKRVQADGQAPMRVMLVGDTAADPRARLAVDAVASELQRFQLAARQQAATGGGQLGVRRQLSNGIQARYTNNNGQEMTTLYVPLPTPGGGETPPPPLTAGKGVLALDVLFAATPFCAQVNGPSGNPAPGDSETAKFQHATCWVAGATITTASGVSFDMISCPNWGATPTPTSRLSVAGHSPYHITKTAAATTRTLRHSSGAIVSTGSGSDALTTVKYLMTSPDELYVDYVGCTFLIYAAYPSEQVTIDLWVANVNTAYRLQDSSPQNLGFGSILNVQCREFASTDRLVEVTVPVSDTTLEADFTFTDIGNGQTGLKYDGSTSASGANMTWSFIAQYGWQDNGHAPADRNNAKMGDLLYATADDPQYQNTQTPACFFAYDIFDGSQLTAKGVAVPAPPNIAWDNTALRTTPSWSGNAATMTNAGTVVWTSRGQEHSKGKAKVTLNLGSTVWPGSPVPTQLGIGGGVVN